MSSHCIFIASLHTDLILFAQIIAQIYLQNSNNLLLKSIANIYE